MIRSKKRIWICGTLIVLNILFIWINSMLPREASAAISRLAWRILSILIPGEGVAADGTGHGVLRKIAHATEFCSLAIFLSWGVRMLRHKTWEFYAFPATAGVAIAAVDEIIQIFSPGRGPHIRDVGIDSIGVLAGILVFTLIIMIKRRKKAS